MFLLAQTDSGDFNLHVYGFVMRLLHDDLQVKWAIKGCKVKGEPDFTADVKKVLPIGGAESVSHDFLNGVFVLSAPAYALQTYLAFVREDGVNPPQVYVLSSDTSVEVCAFTLFFFDMVPNPSPTAPRVF